MARAVIRKLKKKMKGRPRGGASVPCPICGGDTQVSLTRRSDGKVFRNRMCKRDHKFTTAEKIIAA